MHDADTTEPEPAASPLAAVRVLDLAGIGRTPLWCMLLAAMGAEVLRVEAAPMDFGVPGTPQLQTLDRGWRSTACARAHRKWKVLRKPGYGEDRIRALFDRGAVT